MESRLTELEKQELKEDLKQLNELRIYRNECANVYIERKQAFTESTKVLTDKLNYVEESIERLEDTIRSKALEIYNRNKEEGKEVFNGIKERSVVKIDFSHKDALEWCVNHLMFLDYDGAQFRRFLKNLSDRDLPRFVLRTLESTITLPTNIKDIEDV